MDAASEIVPELTEQREVLNYTYVQKSDTPIKKRRVHNHIDDFGEGNANLEMILNTSPEYNKNIQKLFEYGENLEAVRSIIKGTNKQKGSR